MWWQRPPLFSYFAAMAGIGMLLPAGYALYNGRIAQALAFGVSALLICVLAVLLALALLNRTPRITARAQLATLLASYLVLPFGAALPLMLLLPGLSLEQAYFEMLSSLTTTGATLLDRMDVPASIHLWRATVAWQGGFLILLCALAILSPLNLGGFEMQSVVHGAQPGEGWAQLGAAEASQRLLRAARRIVPGYVALTALLAVIFSAGGEQPLHAAIHAMSVLSTSGISGHEQGFGAAMGRLPEILAFLFLIIAATHRGPMLRLSRADADWIRTDPELRILAVIVLSVSTLIVLRHWGVGLGWDATIGQVVRAFWGTCFTVLSFLTTTGFVSADWQGSLDWSGLRSPGLVLLGLAAMGGGVASTAGGIKLLRAYALYRQGLRELGRLTYPNSVGGDGMAARRLRQAGAFIAWVFLMLFLAVLAILMLGLTLTGLDFEAALTLSVAVLSGTGPLYTVAAPGAPHLADLGAGARIMADAGMILGRMETLAVLALLNPANWRS